MPATPDLSSRVRADSLVESEAERDALHGLREVTGETDGPMERHGVRCFAICEELAGRRGLTPDREVMLVAALLHDIGLYDAASLGGVYVSDGADFAAGLIRGREGWGPERTDLCKVAIERHHELRSQWDAGAEVELLRRADLLELSGGLIHFGTGRAWRRRLFAAAPRDGLYGEVGRLVAKAARERPATLPRIFLR